MANQFMLLGQPWEMVGDGLAGDVVDHWDGDTVQFKEMFLILLMTLLSRPLALATLRTHSRVWKRHEVETQLGAAGLGAGGGVDGVPGFVDGVVDPSVVNEHDL